jgi:septal ring factor EnvC (AmiA/AmiB activator)
MNHDYLARIAALEDTLRQKDSQLSLVAETESFLRSALARAEENRERRARDRASAGTDRKTASNVVRYPPKNFADRLKKPKPC